MQTSIFIAKILGLFYLVFGLGVLLNTKHYRHLLEDLIKDRAHLYWGGIFALLVGFLIVYYHNAWQVEWYVLITILGWLGILKGFLLIVFPEAMVDLAKALTKSENSLHVWGVIMLVVGLVLGYFGYMA